MSEETKQDCIKRFGQAAFEKHRQQTREWKSANSEQVKIKDREWKKANPEKVKAIRLELNRNGGKYYGNKRHYTMNGIPHARELIRMSHRREWTPYKQIIAPESQLHHEWIPETADYRGVALVEANPHMHGFIDVIWILEGEITLLTEDDIKNGEVAT